MLSGCNVGIDPGYQVLMSPYRSGESTALATFRQASDAKKYLKHIVSHMRQDEHKRVHWAAPYYQVVNDARIESLIYIQTCRASEIPQEAVSVLYPASPLKLVA